MNPFKQQHRVLRSFAVFAASLFLAALTVPAASQTAPPEKYVESVVQVVFGDEQDSDHIPLAALEAAGKEMHDLFRVLSRGKLDFEVRLIRVHLPKKYSEYDKALSSWVDQATKAALASDPSFFAEAKGTAILIRSIYGVSENTATGTLPRPNDQRPIASATIIELQLDPIGPHRLAQFHPGGWTRDFMGLAEAYSGRKLAQSEDPASLPTRFPWDRRPPKCFRQSAAFMNRQCKEEPRWPDHRTTAERVKRLFWDNDVEYKLSFELIGQAEKELALSDQRFADGKYYSDAWYEAMESLFYWDSARNAKTLEKWKAVNPDSSAVIIADALSVLGQGLNARGVGYANTVSKEGWEIYRQKLKEADAVMDSAPDAVKKSAPWYEVKLTIAYKSGDAAKAQSIFRAATDAWPYYQRLYMTAINYALPRWGGGFDEVESVVKYAYEKTKSKDGAAWYAICYANAFIDDEYTLRDSKVDWALMKQGIRDATAKTSPGAQQLFAFAGAACQMRDREETRRLYDLLDRHPEGKRPDIIAELTEDPCRKFANGGMLTAWQAIKR